jgi:alkylation response protein AidB-like acyl-CoA dehydrogenase
VDFVPDADQQAILDAVDTIMNRHGGPSRVRELGGDEPAYDHELHKHLGEAGYLALAEDGANRLTGALVVETVARKLGVVAAGYHSLVLPSLGLDIEGPIAIVPARAPGLARFAADAEAVIMFGDDEVCVVRPRPGRIARIGSRLGWPIGDTAGVIAAGDHPVTVLDGVSPSEVRTWWRIAIACELVGSMRAALELTVAHVSDRHQFGKPIGSFQAVQHGLAECAVAVEGARWLAFEAAWSGAPSAAATALTAALPAAARVRRDAHQYSGALGFTTEYDLHLSTMRLAALSVEASTIGSPVIAAATSRWPI